MKCPCCGGPKSKTIDSKAHVDSTRWRRRQCTDCDHRWSTLEITEEAYSRLRSARNGARDLARRLLTTASTMRSIAIEVENKVEGGPK